MRPDPHNLRTPGAGNCSKRCSKSQAAVRLHLATACANCQRRLGLGLSHAIGCAPACTCRRAFVTPECLRGRHGRLWWI